MISRKGTVMSPPEEGRDQLSVEEYARIVRKQMMWLTGFAAGIQSPALDNWVVNFRRTLNRFIPKEYTDGDQP